MRFFFDTSVLVAVFLEQHERHEASLKVFLGVDKHTGCCGAHSLAEIYATATRLPGKDRLSGEQVFLFLENVVERLAVVTLTGDEYYTTIKTAVANRIVGGTIYDALLAQCAHKAKAEVVYTWNPRHFRQFGAEFAKRVRTP